MEAAAKQAGAIVNSVMLGAIAGSRPAADPGRGVRGRDQGGRQGGREQPERLPRRARRRARSVAGRRSVAPDKRPAKPTLASSRSRGRGAAGSGARDRHRRRAPPRRVSGPRLCAALSRSPEAASRDARQAARRDRAASRGAHVVRGRDPRRRGQDRAGALPPHRGRDRREGPALRHHGIPQARHRGIVPGAAAAACARDRRAIRRSAAGSARSISAWS